MGDTDNADELPDIETMLKEFPPQVDIPGVRLHKPFPLEETVWALHGLGFSPEEISGETGCSVTEVPKLVESYERKRQYDV